MSACLAGELCAYDGKARPHPLVARLVAAGQAVPACPECLGGLPTPRPPAEIQGGDGRDVLAGRARVVNKEGEDVTAAFVLGARRALELARAHGITTAILKSRSPSCGLGRIYDGTFSGRLRPGHGVTVALFLAAGLTVLSEKDLKEEG